MSKTPSQLEKSWPQAVELFREVDTTLTHWMAEHGITFLRISMGIVFIWFGALKLIPDLSPAEGLIRDTVPLVPMSIFIPFLAIWEMAIGLGFVTGRFMRATILLLFLQMPGTISPVVLNPDAVWDVFPYGLTLEGQYIVKNLIIVSAALVIGATVRGGQLEAEPSESNQ